MLLPMLIHASTPPPGCQTTGATANASNAITEARKRGNSDPKTDSWQNEGHGRIPARLSLNEFRNQPEFLSVLPPFRGSVTKKDVFVEMRSPCHRRLLAASLYKKGSPALADRGGEKRVGRFAT